MSACTKRFGPVHSLVHDLLRIPTKRRHDFVCSRQHGVPRFHRPRVFFGPLQNFHPLLETGFAAAPPAGPEHRSDPAHRLGHFLIEKILENIGARVFNQTVFLFDKSRVGLANAQQAGPTSASETALRKLCNGHHASETMERKPKQYASETTVLKP